ncbi:ABC transporter ATP-binding protein [Paraburkholderia acidiphila]|uniref:ATP-binding cassette domain-containing protein n=1 Tax=Paraburkholderia acidiphila TaxID=2571747 RepID=A0A7Z2G8M2_9BURK|nr:ABC transporter ATP-binding protein [Paraburkholderia acidiphila]QGZ57131.1 ATP-binding cassette domain-containing protein [Paraburkholderia acidiphila]
MIEITGVAKTFGAVCALDRVDLTVRRGELFGLIGRNGAGKSTLFQLMLGLLSADEGRVQVDGEFTGAPRFRAVKRRIGYLPENVVLYDNLSGLETLRFFARLKGVDTAQCMLLLEQVGLDGAAARKVREYSKGMKQRLGFAQALLGEPLLLFLDEPTNGLDPEGIREFYQTLKTRQEAGTTIVITSHILAEIQQRVDRLAILQAGRIHAAGSVPALRDEANLPLSIEVIALSDDIDPIVTALRREPFCDLTILGRRIAFECPRDAKMAAIAALSPLSGRLADLQIHEPSLEDVFLGCMEVSA